MVMGRPVEWTPERKADAIERLCANVATGVSVTRSLQLLDDMPDPRTFWGWMMDDPDIDPQITRAREMGCEALVEEAIDISNTPIEGMEIEELADDENLDEAEKRKLLKIKRKDMLGHRRLQIETRLKYAAMVKPRKYGPKLDLTSDNKPISGDLGDVAARAASLVEIARQRKDGKK